MLDFCSAKFVVGDVNSGIAPATACGAGPNRPALGEAATSVRGRGALVREGRGRAALLICLLASGGGCCPS